MHDWEIIESLIQTSSSNPMINSKEGYRLRLPEYSCTETRTTLLTVMMIQKAT